MCGYDDGGPADTLKGRNLHRLEQWANRNLKLRDEMQSLTPLKEELQPYNEISVIITGLWLSQGILTTLLSAGRTTPQSTTNSGGFWRALASTGRWCVGHHTCKQGRSGWGREGWEQPWLQRPWNGGAQVPESGARQKQITAPDLRRTDFVLIRDLFKKNLMGYSPRAKGGLCGWIRNLNIKRRCTRDGRRDKWPGRDSDRHSPNIQVQDWEKQGPAGVEGQQERHINASERCQWMKGMLARTEGERY